jgi:peptidyl-prolyl cis-trans isomerase C
MAFFPVRRSTFHSSKDFLVLSALLLAGVALLAGCHPAVTDPNDPKFIVAEKGTWQITNGELDAEVASYLKQHQATPEQVGPAKMPMVKTVMLKNMVLKKLLLDKAAALPVKDTEKEEATELDQLKGPASDAEFAAQLKTAGLTLDDLKKKIHEKVLISKVLEAEAFKNIDPTDQEINDIYLKNKDSFNLPAKVRASRILVLVDDKTTPAQKAAAKKAIDQAHARVVHGEDFSKVAMEVSQDQYSAPKGGDINFFQRGENEPGFDDVAFNTKQGAVSPVFQTSLGYQFLKVTDIKPAGVVPVADARGYISSKLREMKMEEQSQAYAKKVLADSGVIYHLTLVDPPAQAAAAPGESDGAPSSAEPDSGPPSAGPDSSASAPPAEAAPADTNGAPAQ